MAASKLAAAKAAEAAAQEDEEDPILNLADVISLTNLSNIGRIVDGSGFAHRALSCVGKRIGPIKVLEGYLHLENIDLSKNCIQDVGPLKGLPYVLHLNLAQNEIQHIRAWEEGQLKFLIHLDLSGNKLTTLPPLKFPALKTANFARNQIADCKDFVGHEKLETLDLSENKIPNLTGVGVMPVLKYLDVSSNELVNIEGLTEVPELQEFKVGKNLLEALELGPWPDLVKLIKLDLSGNKLPTAKPLELLRKLPRLRSLEVAGNPFVEEREDVELSARAEVFICHWRLDEIDGQPVADQERDEAKDENVKRLLEERHKRQLAEEEAAAAEGGGD